MTWRCKPYVAPGDWQDLGLVPYLAVVGLGGLAVLRPSALPRPAETGLKMCLFAMYFGHGVLTDKRQWIFGRQIDHKLDPG